MEKRINWIDWAKALAVMTVVFCHLPQSQEWFYYRYLQAVIIVIFFFLSGYLKKDRGSDQENWRKYWHGLILPYLIYNAIVYPYWLVKYYLLNSGLPDLFSAIKPIFGALLFEHENAFCEPLNGPLWYLPAILIMHVIVDLCKKTKNQHVIMITLCVLSFILYAANKYWYFAPDLTPMGLMRNLPYYYIGYVLGQKRLFRDVKFQRDFLGCIICIIGSLLLFHWHLQAYLGGQHLLHIILFYPVNIGFLFGVLYGCKLIDKYKSIIIINLSIGTLVVIGLHNVLVTVANFALERLLHLNTSICYHWYKALPTTLVIVALLYPVILLGKKYAPMLLGRKRI
jgi:fucose 4-O-acetylase-like acetyltransferase